PHVPPEAIPARAEDERDARSGRCRRHLQDSSPLARHPSTGRPNFATSRSVKGRGRSRTSRTGSSPRRAVTTDPGGASKRRRPSQKSTAPGAFGSTVTVMIEDGAVTRARPNRAWAEMGTRSKASTPGQTTGPPAENAYAVDPVGVAQMTPSQPY